MLTPSHISATSIPPYTVTPFIDSITFVQKIRAFSQSERTNMDSKFRRGLSKKVSKRRKKCVIRMQNISKFYSSRLACEKADLYGRQMLNIKLACRPYGINYWRMGRLSKVDILATIQPMKRLFSLRKTCKRAKMGRWWCLEVEKYANLLQKKTTCSDTVMKWKTK